VLSPPSQTAAATKTRLPCGLKIQKEVYFLYCAKSLRGRLHLRFGCAVWMWSKRSAAMICGLDVQQNVWLITLDAANRAFGCAVWIHIEIAL
jgi:hypothetical protein